MQRINTTNKAVDLFGSGKHGFQSGVPTSGVKATYLSELWCNATQEELASLPEWVGLTLDTALTIPAQDNKQNLKALALVLQKQLMTSVTTAGTAPAYTGTFNYAPAGNPIVTTLTTDLRVRVKIHAGNLGAACTLNLAGLGIKSIKQYNYLGVLVDPIFVANQLVELEYDGTRWIVAYTTSVGRGDFDSSLTSNGWKKYPDKNSPSGYFIEQWGTASVASNTADLTLYYPFVFPNAALNLVATCDYTLGSGSVGYVAAGSVFNNGFTIRSSGNYSVRWRALGH